jgi:tellurite resistance protein TerC
VLRGFSIAAGAALLEGFHWTIYILGGLLFLTDVRLFLHGNKPFEPMHNPLFRLFKHFDPVAKDHRGSHFTVVESGRRQATPLLLALVAVEAADVVFAVDSIPAIFVITPDPFPVFTSNVFAMLGLRSLYFLLTGMMERFQYLGAGLAMVLGFVGLKMLVSGIYELPVLWSLAVISLLIGGSIALSRVRSRGRLRSVSPPVAGSVNQLSKT